MNIDEVIQYITLGRDRAVTIAIDEIPEIPCCVRVVTVHAGNIVCIRFRRAGFDEGGIRFLGRYVNVEMLVQEMEAYLGKSIENWHNYTRSGKSPFLAREDCEEFDWRKFQKIAYSLLPQSGNFKNPND